jgi:hypothetical protein
MIALTVRRQQMLVTHAFKTSTPPQFNGDLGHWRSAELVAFAGRPLGGHPRTARAYTLWDEENLYIAFEVESSKLQARSQQGDGELWWDDGVEFLIDPNRDRTEEFLPDDFSYHINILNLVYDDRGTPAGIADPQWHGAARHAVKIVDDYNYIVEIAVPWVEVGVAPRAGETSLGIDFCVNGRDPDTGEYDYFDWCGLTVFHDPSGFGELRLLGRRSVDD